MKSNILKYTLSIGLFLFLLACSVKKDKFLNRNLHAVTTEYNTLYNGNLALDKGLNELKLTFKDNFWQVLPIERMQTDFDAVLPGQSKNSNFERAEEKAVKAIQKHSMNIGGREKNPQMDEAYLLLAKSRYYDNRFIPSLEALNYILYKYPSSDRIYHAKVWREKVNIRLDNDEIAIKNLKKLLEDKRISGQDLADANAMLAQAYLNIQAKDSAITAVKIAKSSTNSNEEKARYSFILGQLYEALNYQDSAYTAFQDVIDMNRKSPRRYVMQAHAKQTQQFDFKNGDTLVFIEKFTKLLDDRENRPFLDILNHQMALFYDKQKNNNRAKFYYNKSVKSFSEDDYLIASNYRNLGEIYFREANYKIAGKYYDSTLIKLDDKTREYRKIKKKRINLDDVIKYESIAQHNDSILSVIGMNDADRIAYYENFILKLKVEDQKKEDLAAEVAKKEENLKQNLAANSSPSNIVVSNNANPIGNPGPGVGLPPGIGTNDNSVFYFYNPITVEYGKKEFQNRWGSRSLEDNWRWTTEGNNLNFVKTDTNQEEDGKKDEIIVSNPKYDPQFYIKQLPTDTKVIDSLSKNRNFAYYQLGIIYKEKFGENELAASRLEQLLLNNPEERLLLPTKYNLYKIYQVISLPKAEIMKNQILAEYPNSRYAEIIKNPTIAIAEESNPEAVYYATFKKYENNQLREVFFEMDSLLEKFSGEESVAKFELLKAKVLGRLKGLEVYRKALNNIALTYPNIQEGKEAEKILQNDLPFLEAMNFDSKKNSDYKIIFQKPIPFNANSKSVVEKITKYINDTNAVALKLSTDIYNVENDFIVVHGFDNKEAALSVLSVLRDFKNYKISDQAYIISTEDYKIVQMKKKFEEWIALNK
ncbi:lipopolysaccharide assembly protein LapB [Flavobacterium cucumis]|uniref:Protein involved in gliding motility SprE n=1 Tax=Flavobacterium cucumis TaxID=416016 RepID=A0A1M7ZTY9_9FLAO|nr:gliding motility protein [Flavobacterium cucumis]SHO72332.1 protein involved in gliding motility SprE [Flavobacterium cucumis]